MINKKIVESLRQIDVSTDKEKTKERVRELWQPLETSVRTELLQLAGISKGTVARSYTNGNITPRLTAAFAIILGVNPYYITGESDTTDGYSDELMLKFTEGKTHKKKRARKSVKAETAKTKNAKAGSAKGRTKSVKAEDVITEAAEEAAPEPIKKLEKVNDIIRIISKASSLSADEIASLNDMPEEEIVYLVKGLLYRSKYSTDANELMFFVRFLLTI